MRLADAEKLIAEENQPKTYRVTFERRERGLLVSDHFPERDEKGYESEHEAWGAALRFSRVDPLKYVNIYVINAKDWRPVGGYRDKMLNPIVTTG